MMNVKLVKRQADFDKIDHKAVVVIESICRLRRVQEGSTLSIKPLPW
jgi:hypothetical protein